jgi:hypothetical protein
MYEATRAMMGQTGLPRALGFFGLRSDTTVVQPLDNLQPYFPIQSDEQLEESSSRQEFDNRIYFDEARRMAEESERLRQVQCKQYDQGDGHGKSFGRRDMTWSDKCTGRVIFAAQPIDVLMVLLGPR